MLWWGGEPTKYSGVCQVSQPRLTRFLQVSREQMDICVGPTLPGISARVTVAPQKLFSADPSLPFSCSKTTQRARTK